MNKFRILGVIAIIAIIANFFGGLDENWRDFKKGFEDGHNSAMEIYEPGRHIIPHHATSVKLNVEPLPETTVDSLSNNRVDWTLPYTVTEIETYAKPSAWHILVMGLAIPGIFLFLIGFCSLIRLLISISRREVFTSANVRRLRWFAYTSACVLRWMPSKKKHLLFDTLPDSYSVCKFIHLFPCVTSIVGQQNSEDIDQHWMDLLLSVCL